ncbi:PepSY domain-containing protein [Zunongwangia endophytica]|uniref:NADPH--hemoprotein reductase n=1 Tax=Zunongwangia endophytica TaxID=1808945 RepID=A0ABV8H728_9FLAO|nr:PepSY domain-containing protein [Zunongwangia endophytica]MDN3595469.1 PepSY domain-containing protein [Zunongwangia endophytica]
MILSIWRYSHLSLAVSSFVFILIASVTGIILAFEPIDHAALDYKPADNSVLPVSEVIKILQSSYDEVLSLEVDAQGFTVASVFSMEGDSGDFYINPETGIKIGEIEHQSSVFQFATSLHRSLFLKSTGRIFVGITSFLLFLINISGLILVIKRQQGFKAIFDKIVRENFYSYYHIYLGRLSLIPIIIITVTGVFLSLLRFNIIPEVRLAHTINEEKLVENPQRILSDFPSLEHIYLDDVRSIEFPFSEDASDPFKISLQNKEILVNQYTGEVISELPYPLINLISGYSYNLHTGRGNVIWAVILALSCISILFFIYSGFAITLKRRKSLLKNKFKKDEAEIVILVGSETGGTMSFAKLFQQELIKNGKKVFIAQMDQYAVFKKMGQLVIFTSTYGDGEPPANAKKFLRKFNNIEQKNTFSYSVVGFGSLAYPSYCKYAFDVDQQLYENEVSHQFLKPYTINNKSWEAFDQWVDQWSNKVGITVNVPRDNDVTKQRKKTKKYKILYKTKASESPDDTFVVGLAPIKKQKIKSGDLLAIYPTKNDHERLYSIGKDQEYNILLSIKKHEFGLCSNFLNDAKEGSEIDAVKVKNPDFHFNLSKNTIMIATGTGIAPFIGMMQENAKKQTITLYWGGRNEASFNVYKNRIDSFLNNGRLTEFLPAYSRISKEKVYVQHLVARDAEKIAKSLQDGSVIMICGSILMQKEIVKSLTEICKNYNNKPLSFYQKKGQLKMDCY